MTGPLPPLAAPAITSEPRPASHRSFTDTLIQPAAGTDWSFVPSSSDWSRLLSITATLTTTGAGSSRAVAVTVTDTDGLALTRDTPPSLQGPSTANAYGWRSGSLSYGGGNGGTPIVGSIPGFWLPPGATVAADTINLDPASAATPASATTGDQTANLPVTIVTGVNDTFTWTGQGGGGTPTDFVIDAGVYTTTADMASAIAGASDTTPVTFDTQATVVDDGAGGYLVTAVADIGSDGNGDSIASAMSNDAWASIVTGGTELDLSGGVDADGGDQWTDIVATYVVAYAAYWQTLAAMLDQAAGAR